ncbi:MAG: glycoside hydrolase family 127 protein [Anaerolineae bacterium]
MTTPTHSLFHPLPLGAIEPRGWLLDQMRQDLSVGFAACLDTLTEHAAHNLFRHQIAASAEQFAWWDAETRGNWLWGLTMMAFLSGDEDAQARAVALLDDLLATQGETGYLGIYARPWRYRHGDSENGELWAQSRALLALLAYYEFTGRAATLHAVETAVALTMAQYGAQRSYFRSAANPLASLTGVTHGLCYVDVVEWLFALTGDARYRDFGLWLYDDFCALPLPFANDDMSTRSLLDARRPLSGHAVHTAEHVRVLAWAYAVTGRDDLARAFALAQAKLSRCTLPSGALIGDEGIHGLPLPEAAYEYCTITEYLFSLTSVLQKFGTGADHVETLLFNAGQGARLPGGGGVAYLSQDTRLDARVARPDSYSLFHGGGGRFKFSPTHEDVACCCNPNAIRLLPHYVSRQWMRLADTPGLAALLYGACRVRTVIEGVAVEIEEITDYPFDETVRLVISPAQPTTFTLALRQPGWASGAAVSVNGIASAPTQRGDLLMIQRRWESGDTVAVSFETEVAAVAYPNGEYAVRRGALQFVQPIAPAFHATKHYPNSALADVELWPQDLAQAYRPFFLDAARPGYGLTLERLAGGDPAWHAAALALAGADGRLVPMGSAMLRRAAFPMLNLAPSPRGMQGRTGAGFE